MSTPRQLAVYIHWPFCLAKCPYCDFNSHVRHGGVDSARFTAALKREMAHFARLAPDRKVTSIFFGGGTPSLMPARAVAALVECAAAQWSVADDVEITLEANPTSVEAGRFADYRAAGVNRVSVGVQSLDDRALAFLGRRHTAQQALAAFRLARKTFERASFDMIYARPGQSVDDWRTELSRALAEQPDHMSLYQLTIEPGTRFFDRAAAGKLTMPDADHAADLYQVTGECTAAAGLHAYEVSNHARPGHACRHNLAYWRYGEYAGIGAGAHSRLVSDNGLPVARENRRDPQAWLEAVEASGHATASQTRLSAGEAASEYLLMALRLDEGVSLGRYRQLAGAGLDERRLADLVADGLVHRPRADHVAATARGRLVLNRIISELA